MYRFVKFRFLFLCLWFIFCKPYNILAQSLVKFNHRSYVAASNGIGNLHYIVNNKESIRKNNQWSVDIATVNGIRIKRHELGIGVGIDLWKKIWFVPVFINYSFAFMDKKISPYGSFDIGYALGKKQDFYVGDTGRGSVLVKPSFGVQVQITPKLFFVSQVFYKMQSIRTDYYSGGYNPTPEMANKRTMYTVYYHFLGISASIKI